MNDWREDFRGFEDDPEGLQKAISGLIVLSPVLIGVYLSIAVFAAL